VPLGWSGAMVLATVAVLVALTAPSSQVTWPAGAAHPSRLAVGGPRATLQSAVLPARGPGGVLIAADRPSPTPSAVGAVAGPALAARTGNRRRWRRGGARLVRRRSAAASGGPRAPPAAPRPD
jgi:hypothetical protein